MTQTYVYYDDTGAWSVDLGNTIIRLGDIGGFSEAANLGENASSTIIFDDPTNSVGHSGDGVRGLKSFRVLESAAPSNDKRIITAYITDRGYKHGDQISPSLRTGVMRRISANLVDLNAALGFILIQGTKTAAHGDRPAETVGARLTWLLGSAYVNFYDNGRVVYPGAPTLTANDYRGQTAGDVLSDCALPVSYNYFLYFDEAADQISLYFNNSNTSTDWYSTLYLTNDLALVDSSPAALGSASVVAATIDLNRSPAKVASGADVPYAGGDVFVTNGTTQTTYARRERTAPNANVHSSAAATVLGNRYLAENLSEEDVLSIDYEVPSSAVNLVRAGMRVPILGTHLGAMDEPTYDAWRWVQVLRRGVSQTAQTPDVYQIHLDASPMEGTDGRGGDVLAPPAPYYILLGATPPTKGYRSQITTNPGSGGNPVASTDQSSYSRIDWSSNPGSAVVAIGNLSVLFNSSYDPFEAQYEIIVSSTFSPLVDLSQQRFTLKIGPSSEIEIGLKSFRAGGVTTITVDTGTGSYVAASWVSGTITVDVSRVRGNYIVHAGGVTATHSQTFAATSYSSLLCGWDANSNGPGGPNVFAMQIAGVQVRAR